MQYLNYLTAALLPFRTEGVLKYNHDLLPFIFTTSLFICVHEWHHNSKITISWRIPVIHLLRGRI